MAALALMLPGPQPGDTEAATIVVAPSPILGTHVLEHVLQPAINLFPGGSVYADFESWSAVTVNHQELLRRLATYGPLVFLSGDVHYSTTGAFEYARTGGGAVKAAQVTSSSSKNADTKTMVMHLLGDLALKLGLERERTVRGFTALSNAPAGRACLTPRRRHIAALRRRRGHASRAGLPRRAGVAGSLLERGGRCLRVRCGRLGVHRRTRRRRADAAAGGSAQSSRGRTARGMDGMPTARGSWCGPCARPTCTASAGSSWTVCRRRPCSRSKGAHSRCPIS